MEPINTAPLQQFIKQVQAAETGRQKEIRMDIVAAKNLALTIGIVMSRMHGDLEKFVAAQKTSTDDQVIKIDMDSGSW